MNQVHPIEHEVYTRLRAQFSPSLLEVVNESSQHAGHVGAQGGAQHLFVRIVSAQFSGIKSLQAHRMIYNALLDLMPYPIHAVRIALR